ncbi:MAG: hypothetical protein AAFR59_11925, partial [Bacteroidota bacterium]
DRIAYEEARFISINRRVNYQSKLPKIIRSGIVHRIGLGLTAPTIETDAPFNRFFERPLQWSLTYSLGYRFNRMHTIGLGTGFQHQSLGWHLPVFLEAESDFFQGDLSPTFSARATFLAPIGSVWRVDRLKSGNSYRIMAGLRKRNYSGRETRLLFGWQYAFAEGERVEFDGGGNFIRNTIFARETGFIFAMSFHLQ